MFHMARSFHLPLLYLGFAQAALTSPAARTLAPWRLKEHNAACLPLRRMIGPSIILAGLALGSGEYVLWPYITF